MRSLFYLIPIIFITGCSSTGVVPIGQNSYFIGKKDGTPGIGISLKNKAYVYQEANLFCSTMHKEIFVLSEITIPTLPARLGSTELRFKCI
ncbi:hypothetical protein LVY74_01210 [Acinetobacter sp. ME22]|uniref:hypothetical protein n=1 Tax=Acinetobacter sp. ME22 TaxID=2904802 RepID=UPI001EDAF921|nr:hypothetical protein [Acinetobacter sp. ME22]MCG2572176.1 hypothetical protein [Acinetobacter sp. ME22]